MIYYSGPVFPAFTLYILVTMTLCLKYLVYLKRFLCAHPYMILALTNTISKYDSSSAKKRK